MAKILIRSSDRRILFFTYDDLVPDLSRLFTEHQEHHAGDHELIKTARPPGNLRLGSYLNAAQTSAEPEPGGDYGAGVQRQKTFTAWLDGQIVKLSTAAILTLPEAVRQNWTLYLRMCQMVAIIDYPFRDARQWPLLAVAQTASPFDFVLTVDEQGRFDNVQAEGGLYFKAWWGHSSKMVETKPISISNTKLNPTSPNYDVRTASKVTLIPEGEIDRRDTTAFASTQLWGSRDNRVAQMNARMPFYER